MRSPPSSSAFSAQFSLARAAFADDPRTVRSCDWRCVTSIDRGRARWDATATTNGVERATRMRALRRQARFFDPLARACSRLMDLALMDTVRSDAPATRCGRDATRDVTRRWRATALGGMAWTRHEVDVDGASTRTRNVGCVTWNIQRSVARVSTIAWSARRLFSRKYIPPWPRWRILM